MFKSIKRFLIAGTAMLALCAPSATFAFVRGGSVAARSDISASPIVAVAGHPAPRGFGWGDAGIGALAMLALVGVGSGAAFVTVRRQRHQLAS